MRPLGFLLRFALWGSALTFASRAVGSAWIDSTARVCAMLLRLLGRDVTAYGERLIGEGLMLNVVGECTAAVPLTLLLAGTLAHEARWRNRILGSVLGAGVLLAVNQVRLVSLWFTLKHAPGQFDLLHNYLWQPGMIAVVAVLWVLWLGRSSARQE